MKRIILLVVIVLGANSRTPAQSRSFQALENKFASAADVHTFNTSGLFARTLLWLAGEHEFRKAVKEVKAIRLMTIPVTAFEKHAVSLNGFKKVVKADVFEELVSMRYGRDEVTVYLQTGKHAATNRYLILIYNPEEVVAVEIKGYINVDQLNSQNRNIL